MHGSLREIVFSVAKHEVGHWLAWHCYGGSSSGIEVKILSINGRHTGAFIPDMDWEVSTLDDACKYVKARLLCLHSGIYAESFLGDIYDTERIGREFNHLGGAASDFHRSIELTWAYCNLTGRSDQYREVCSEIDQEAAKLVANNFEFIKHAAKVISDMAVYEGQLIKIPDYELQSMYEKFKHQR
ncbi:hypothetical protein [Enterobacter roggenkampii]|uniref:hypothetical protein n=1 Tax=Enterobacter roggenkampii TaxID=1812935 RepID=UPI001C6FF24F|nr:hypothetical protein [Enterobacter roggenkampii]MBW9438420.1 hypothetical protein [Enterobacter roggenkampii]